MKDNNINITNKKIYSEVEQNLVFNNRKVVVSGTEFLQKGLKENLKLNPQKVQFEGTYLNILNKCSNLATKTNKQKNILKQDIESRSEVDLKLKQQKSKADFSNGFYVEEKDAIETKFITKLMRKGKKEKAENLLIKALKKLEQELIKKEVIKALNHGLIEEKGFQKNSIENKTRLNLNLSKDLSKEQKGNIKQNQNKVKEELKSKSLSLVDNKLVHKKGSQSEALNLVKLLSQIIENAKPLIRLKKIRIAGATHQKPIALTRKQSETDAIKRIILNTKLRSEKSTILRLAKEFEEIYLNIMSNKTLTEVRELHKLAEINKANLTLK